MSTEPAPVDPSSHPVNAVYVATLAAVVVFGGFMLYADHNPIRPVDPSDPRTNILQVRGETTGEAQNIVFLTGMVSCLLAAVFLFAMGLANLILRPVQHRSLLLAAGIGMLAGGTCVAEAMAATWWLPVKFPKVFLWLPVAALVMFRRSPTSGERQESVLDHHQH